MYGKMKLEKEGWPYPPQTALTHITYLSDGNCGSTCSGSSSTPYLNGLATFVTFGGVKGEAMDITSFNGGNVGTYQSRGAGLWKSAISPVVDASIFHPDDKSPATPFAPIPMNIASAQFAQRAEYPRALGPQALPREWYNIPASYNLDVWAKSDLNKYGQMTNEARWQLYDLYAATSALKPKPLARTL